MKYMSMRLGPSNSIRVAESLCVVHSRREESVSAIYVLNSLSRECARKQIREMANKTNDRVCDIAVKGSSYIMSARRFWTFATEKAVRATSG